MLASILVLFLREYGGFADVFRHSNIRVTKLQVPTRNLQASCDVNGSFTVTAPKQPCLEGCYLPTNSSHEGVTMFTPSGDFYAWSQMVVVLSLRTLSGESSEVGDGDI